MKTVYTAATPRSRAGEQAAAAAVETQAVFVQTFDKYTY